MTSNSLVLYSVRLPHGLVVASPGNHVHGLSNKEVHDLQNALEWPLEGLASTEEIL